MNIAGLWERRFHGGMDVRPGALHKKSGDLTLIHTGLQPGDPTNSFQRKQNLRTEPRLGVSEKEE